MGTYRVGVIGSGGIGIQHGEGVLGVEDAAVVACCDLLPETTDAFREHFAEDQGVPREGRAMTAGTTA